MMFCFRKNYFIWTLILLLIEVIIAVFIRDQFIRPHGGDVLVVTLVYCFLRTFLRMNVAVATITALSVAFAAEVGQYFHLTHALGIEHNQIASAFFGNSFDVNDFLWYSCGALLIVSIEYFLTKNLRSASKKA